MKKRTPCRSYDDALLRAYIRERAGPLLARAVKNEKRLALPVDTYNGRGTAVVR